MLAYGGPPSGQLGDFLYGLTTSGGMIGLITCMVGGVFIAVAALLIGASGGWALAAGIVGTGVIFVALATATFGSVARNQAQLEIALPDAHRGGAGDGPMSLPVPQPAVSRSQRAGLGG